ncbi:MAG TPA: hypothetical protein VFN13_10415 [Rudaea sp.]|nr:hypothetical protein [Rudaea sp.]
MQGDWQGDIRARAQARIASAAQKRWFQRLRFWALGLALVLHSILLVGLREAMQVPMQHQDGDLQIVLLDLRPPPLPQPPPIPKRIRAATGDTRAARAAAAASPPQSAMSSSMAPSVPPLQLFNRNGSIWQPTRPLATTPTPQERAEELLQRGHNILHCRPTRFTRTYRYDESLGDRIARKYLVWVGLYGQAPRDRLQRRLHEAAAACDAE